MLEPTQFFGTFPNYWYKIPGTFQNLSYSRTACDSILAQCGVILNQCLVPKHEMRCSAIPSHDYEADCSLAVTYFKNMESTGLRDSILRVDDPTTQTGSQFPYFSPGKTRLRKVRIVSSKEGYAGLRHRSLADGTIKMLNGCSSLGSSSIKFFRQLPKWPRTLSYFS